MIESERIEKLNSNKKSKGKFIIYWMQQSQRTHFNHALYYAIEKANKENLPIIVYFGLTDKYPEANLRHYTFMIQGLIEVNKNLKNKKINFVIKNEDPSEGIIELSDEARMVIVDRGYTRIQTEWRENVSKKIDCQVIQIESDIVVPVEKTSQKEEYGAYTIRPKINRFLSNFISNLKDIKPKKSSLEYDFDRIVLNDEKSILNNLSLDRTVKPSKFFNGGFSNAKKILNEFLNNRLDKFDNDRNDPSKKGCSNLSPYLHFGQISPIEISLETMKFKNINYEPFLEELIVRRELGINFVYFNKEYDKLKCLPKWAYDSLKKHEKDTREYIYNIKELESANTHDKYWNAAQKEMLLTGKMHGYMRMYWGKKIIEWTKSPKQAFEYALYLNNKYELDGRDPNGFAGVAWCFGKHDRAWKERQIFGKIRYMNETGLKRKYDIDKYLDKINQLDQKYMNEK